jgi:hypothetical protein
VWMWVNDEGDLADHVHPNPNQKKGLGGGVLVKFIFEGRKGETSRVKAPMNRQFL